ncbi:MAG: glycerol kinase [Oceanicoccus sp.]|jgi:glycerol kinase
MSTENCILSIDQGTTSSRAIVFDKNANVVATAQQEFDQIYPADGWVEHDPEVIFDTVLDVCRRAKASAEQQGFSIIGIGITNQRETTVVWDRLTGKAIYNAIVWQDRRTADLCTQLKDSGLEAEIQSRTGLLLDPYFSATKLSWILDNVPGARQRAENGELAFGTIDSFLIWRLTAGNVHATDATNASRTNLYNIHSGKWDPELLMIFNAPAAMLPKVLDCSAHYGDTDVALLGQSLPICGVAGDQQAATIGQCCFEPGSIKSTYGTGCFVLINSGEKALTSNNRLLTTIAYQFDGKPTYAIEGSIFVAGAAVQWLRDGLGIIDNAGETEAMASGLDGNKGVYVVPAFTGLGAPYWRPDVRGAIYGLTRATGPAEIVRATLESVCYLTADLFEAMAQDGIKPQSLKVDGGMVANDWLLQFLADTLDMEVCRPAVMETTALGVAYLAGRQLGLYGNLEEFTALWRSAGQFQSRITRQQRNDLVGGWRDAVRRSTLI